MQNCKKQEPYVIVCHDGPVDWEHMKPTSFDLQNVGDRPGQIPNILLTIQSQIDYEYYFRPVRILPAIDFERKTLLLVRTDEHLAFLANMHVEADCSNELLTWQVDALRPDTLAQNPDIRQLILTIVVPKINDKTDVIFKPKIVN